MKNIFANVGFSLSEMDDWNPLQEAFVDESFNSYTRGPAKGLVSRGPYTRQYLYRIQKRKMDSFRLLLRMLHDKMYTEQVLSITAGGAMKVDQ